MIGNQRIRLFNDRVGCGSCHSLYAQTEKNLVDRYEMGVLCRQCHIK
ncbi:MAG: cytochrome c3 family protein [Planctomycetota bacterium]